MNKKIGIFIGICFVAIVVIGGLFVFLYAKKGAKREAEEAAMEQRTLALNKQMAEEEAPTQETEILNGSSAAKDAAVKKVEEISSDTLILQKNPGSYEAHAAEKLSRAVTGDVVLFFRALTCADCQALDADIRSHLKYIPEKLTILDVDYETAVILKQRYDIKNEHTLVQVDAIGTPIKTWSGTRTLARLISEVL